MGLGAKFTCVAWNGGGVIHKDPSTRIRKVSEVLRLCREFAMASLCETHGRLLALQHHLAMALRTHYLLCSSVKGIYGEFLSNAGGVCVLVARTLFAHLPASPLHLAPPSNCCRFIQYVEKVARSCWHSFPDASPNAFPVPSFTISAFLP